MVKQDKPWSARQTRKFLKKPIEKYSLEELEDAYRALWDLIQADGAMSNPSFNMWLNEQAKIKRQLTIKRANHGYDQYGYPAGQDSELQPGGVGSEGAATESGGDTESDPGPALHGV